MGKIRLSKENCLSLPHNPIKSNSLKHNQQICVVKVLLEVLL